MEYVNGHRAVGYGGGTEGSSVKGADDGKEQQRPSGKEVAGKEQAEQEVATQEHCLARKAVDHVAAEGTGDEGRERVAREDEAYQMLARSEGFAHVERKQGREQHE